MYITVVPQAPSLYLIWNVSVLSTMRPNSEAFEKVSSWDTDIQKLNIQNDSKLVTAAMRNTCIVSVPILKL